MAKRIGAVDRGWRVIVVADAVCSSSDEGHDALMNLYRDRFAEQSEAVDSQTILSQWPYTSDIAAKEG